ncbi:hypothetical protein BJ912DRAFT_989408 [Pholiota molesta]|nr:hypothetical protein BJ912DRAFT_989408 [Pholiota molesta]
MADISMSITSITRSPFTSIPYDVLREIFHQCLPEDRLNDNHCWQPSTKTAPLLLCHVCSSWKAAALEIASLWTHLHIRLPIVWDDEGNPLVRNSAAFMRDIEFMKWWRTKHRSMAPFLRFGICPINVEPRTGILGTHLDSEAADFLFDYMSSAHYLDIGLFYPYLIRHGVERGLRILLPKLHTLIWDSSCLLAYDEEDEDDDDEYYVVDAKLDLPSQIPATVRHLSIQYTIPHEDPIKNLDSWSTLTHLSVGGTIHSHTWFSILPALKDLQWGSFKVISVDTAASFESTHKKISLFSLRTLTVDCFVIPGSPIYPLNALFTNLHLPALRTLSLISHAATWRDSRAATEIQNVLKSAPAVTQLSLGPYFLCYPDNARVPTSTDRAVPPLPLHAPHLSHLKTELVCLGDDDAIIVAKGFVKNLFLSKEWLDLSGPANNIRKVTIIVKPMRWDVDSQFENIFKALLLWIIQRYIETMPNVSFEVASESEHGINLAMGEWRTWSSTV